MTSMSVNMRRVLLSTNTRLKQAISSYTSTSTSNNDIRPVICNRNPHNLEKLRIGLKPEGYFLEKPGFSYWHKLKLVVGLRHLTGQIVHYTGSVAVSASTKEWAINKHLYKTTDHSAYVNLARVLAQRCHEVGIIEFLVDIETKSNTKISAFVEELEKEGLILSEPDLYRHPQPSDPLRPEKPWEVQE